MDQLDRILMIIFPDHIVRFLQVKGDKDGMLIFLNEFAFAGMKSN